jgi:predicted DNA-binding transcriptional regulator YafY
MSESSQLVRQWKLLLALESSYSGCTIQDLMAELEMSDKTIRRDLRVLQAVFNITETTGDRGRKRWNMPPLSEVAGFNLTDLLSIHMGRQFLEPLAGTPFWEGHRKVLAKIRQAIGNDALRYMDKLAAAVHATNVGVSDYSERGKLVDALMVAIEDRKITLIVYQSMQATEPVEQEIYPLGMIHHRGSLYLIAWSSRRREVRNYKVDRIDSVDVQNLRYEVPRDFSLQDWVANSFGVYRTGRTALQTIRIHFSRDSARYVQESRWHHSQQLTLQKDGSLIAEFRLPDTTEIKTWIMSFGPRATVLEPAELVTEIEQDLNQMLAGYDARKEVT